MIGEEYPITAIQVVIVRKKGEKEQLKSIDIPVRDQRDVAMQLDTNDWGLDMMVSVRSNPQYSIQYVMRTEEAATDGQLPPYCDGIFSSTDVAGIKARLQLAHEREISKLEAKLKRRDKTLRQLRAEKAERKRLKI